MIEIRFHGRGGQGAVTSAEVLATAAINSGKFAQAFPSFGPERRGAPVIAFARISDERILNRTKVYSPDIIIVLDPSIMKIVNVSEGIKENGLIVANTKKSPLELRDELKIDNINIATVNATRIALDFLRRPITNIVMLGAVLKIQPLISIDSLIEPLTDRFGKIAFKNIEACKEAYKQVKCEKFFKGVESEVAC
jgi:2-oxoacid:acceptor oxidoreductase gamma subunit (pyruvate/2-ketoisovalerate family)